MYRIGVDARLLSEAVTGIGRYTQEMLDALIGYEHSWTLYSHRPIVVGDWRKRDNVRIRTANLPWRGLRMAWAQSALPWWAAQDGIELFWAPTHRLPRYLPDRIARVVTVHDLVWKHAGQTMRPLSRWLDAKLMPEAVRLADRVIAVSEHTARDLLTEFPEAEGKVRVVPLGASALLKPQPRETLQTLGIDGPFFLFVGTLEPRKNLHRLLEAYASLPEGVRDSAQMVIAGGKGWGGVDVPSIAAQLNIKGRIRIVGHASDALLSTLYAHALFLAMPSLYEGFGLPLVEAMAMGTPVLTSNCASMPEVAGDAGLLVDPSDVNSISNGLLAMIMDHSLRQRLSEKAKATAARYSWGKAAEATLKIFDEAVQARKEKLHASRQ
jgi:glycosyltransferase involved in cell wall biosynthesis